MSFHNCTYDRGVRFILALDSRFPATVPVFALINYFSLNDPEAIPDPKKLRGEDPNRIFALLLSRAFMARKVRPAPGTKCGNLMGENKIIPKRTGRLV
jgi:hypothetical protein